ncbi:hypothetical protein Aglo03_04470 [Actinokineospora globicatena]|uniref:Uncharacterized protein n=1 Tax=Actinokineospora globicatena TaxID=103729 RepID=A0A9W6V854_9PSEU|nr:hypothetical protein Aglo03_04470 [Actinokineospora globicatena]
MDAFPAHDPVLRHGDRAERRGEQSGDGTRQQTSHGALPGAVAPPTVAGAAWQNKEIHPAIGWHHPKTARIPAE